MTIILSRLLPRQSRLAARAHRGARRDRIAERRSGRGQSMRRRAGVATRRRSAARSRACRRPPPAITCARASAAARGRSCCSAISTPCGRSASSQRMPLKREGGKLYGPGVFDMKAGIGLAMLATRALLDRGELDDCRIVMLWTTDEEIGSTTSRALIEAEASKSDAVLVFEPSLPGGALKTSRKGVGQFEMIARGVSAHAGLDPGKGVSAIRELARQIIAIDDLQDPANGVTLTVGVVSGGTRANVVPAEARATIDARAITRADADRVQRAMQCAAAAHRPAPARSDRRIRSPAARAHRRGRRSCSSRRRPSRRRFGIELEEGSAGGGSDGNFTAALGVPDTRRIRRDRRRRARASRARRDRRAGAAGRDNCRSASPPVSRLRSSRRSVARLPTPVARAHQRHHFLHALVVVLRHVLARVELLVLRRPSRDTRAAASP